MIALAACAKTFHGPIERKAAKQGKTQLEQIPFDFTRNLHA
jgi:hypothetical protein